MPALGISTILTIVYNANGGTGAPSSHSHTQVGTEYPIQNTITLSSTTPSRSGYYFCGWATSANATSAQYSAGGSYTYTFAGNNTHTTTLYAVWGYRITYDKGTYGTGTNATQNKPKGGTVKLKDAIFTRAHFTQVGWTTTNGSIIPATYALGANYSTDANITLYPAWKASNSTIATLSSSVDIGVSNAGHLTLNVYNENDYLHRVEFTYGSRSQVYNNVTNSLDFTIPLSWLNDFPTTVSGTATCTVKTFDGSALVGSSVSHSFTIKVPSTEKPSVSLAVSRSAPNNTTVNGWNVLVQGYSKITLTATVSATTGTTIDTISFSGDGVNQTGSGTSVTSSILTSYGTSRTWTCIVKDKRGRTTTVTHSEPVYQYKNPSISSLYAERALNDGTVSPSEGTYIKAKAVYSIASCGGNNSVSIKKIQYKLHTASSWSNGTTSATSGTYYTFGSSGIAITNNYDVMATVKDAVGNTTTYTVLVSSVVGFAFGLNGQCARFGGPVQYADKFENDFAYLGHENITVQRGASGDTGLTAERTDTGRSLFVGVGSGGYNHGVYSDTDGKWLIYDDSDGKTRIPDTLYLAKAPIISGHNTALGYVKPTANLSSQKNITSGTALAVVSISLEAGTWIIIARARFSANATGYRRINISTTSASTDAHLQVPAVSGAVTQLALTKIVSPTATTTYYLNAYQNSGSTLTMAAGGSGEINALTAIRIL